MTVRRSRAIVAVAVTLLAAFGLASCRTPHPASTQASSGGATAPAPERSEAVQELRIEPRRSLLVILVRRGGPLARLGHNHVIAARTITGVVELAPDRQASTFELHLPVAEFTVDEESLRALEGAEFATPVPEDARAATRHNMLSEALLDGERYPQIVLRSQRIVRTAQGFRVTVEISLKGLSRSITLPVHLEESDGGIVATGETALLQSALGLEPFSVMLGALRVEDELEVRLRAVALPAARDNARG